MSYLNLREGSLGLEFEVSATFSVKLSLELNSQVLDEFISHLDEIYSTDSDPKEDTLQLTRGVGEHVQEELRVGLPKGFTLFWKRKSEARRMIVAHPEADQWVGTLALGEYTSSQLIQEFRDLKPGQSVRLSQVFQPEAVSNLDVEIRLLD